MHTATTLSECRVDIGCLLTKPTPTTRYHYDRAGLLVTATTPPGTATTSTYDAAGRSITRTDATGATLTSAYERYTHGPGLDEPLLVRDGQPYVYHPSDAIASV